MVTLRLFRLWPRGWGMQHSQPPHRLLRWPFKSTTNWVVWERLDDGGLTRREGDPPEMLLYTSVMLLYTSMMLLYTSVWCSSTLSSPHLCLPLQALLPASFCKAWWEQDPSAPLQSAQRQWGVDCWYWMMVAIVTKLLGEGLEKPLVLSSLDFTETQICCDPAERAQPKGLRSVNEQGH